MLTKIAKIDPEKLKKSYRAIDEAASLLRGGALVAFPTETVYGLGADAFNGDAIRAVYEVKGRPPDNPLIIHISDIGQLELLTDCVSDCARALINRFWPGPLTMVFKKKRDLPGFVTANLDTIAVRMPSHPVAQALIKAAGTPVAAPSANPSGKPSPTDGGHVIHDLKGKIAMIIDAGPVQIGLESTVLDVSVAPAVILRPGGVTYEMIAETTGSDNIALSFIARDNIKPANIKPCPTKHGEHTSNKNVRSPGTAYKHYAPDAPMLLLKGDRLNAAFWMGLYIKQYSSQAGARNQTGAGRSPDGAIGILASDELIGALDPDIRTSVKIISLGSADAPEIAARRFYGALREFDKTGVDFIICEMCAQNGVGAALTDRMVRASDSKIINADNPTVLFVCTGNTCRSAMAEAIFNDEVKKHNNCQSDSGEPSKRSYPKAVSAGLYAGDGDPAAYDAIETLKRSNVDLRNHKAQSLDNNLVKNANIILAMTQSHKMEILRRFPDAALNTYTISEFTSAINPEASGAAPGDIGDPYGFGPAVYEKCASSLFGMIAPIVASLINR